MDTKQPENEPADGTSAGEQTPSSNHSAHPEQPSPSRDHPGIENDWLAIGLVLVLLAAAVLSMVRYAAPIDLSSLPHGVMYLEPIAWIIGGSGLLLSLYPAFRASWPRCLSTVAIVALIVFYLLDYWERWPLPAAISWIVVTGLIIVYVGPLARRAIGTLLILGLYIALLLSPQGIETVRSLTELGVGWLVVASLVWLFATAMLGILLADTAQAMLRETRDGHQNGKPYAREVLVSLMYFGPAAAAAFSLGMAQSNGWAQLAIFIYAGAALICAFIPASKQIFAPIFSNREAKNEKFFDLSGVSIAAACLLALGLGVAVVVSYVRPSSNIAAPFFLLFWFGALILLLALVRGFLKKLFGEVITVPIVALLILIAVVLSVFDLNDNHEIAYQQPDKWKPAPFAADAFRAWLGARPKPKQEKPPFEQQKPPSNAVFIVTAEGGGARAAYLTALTLEVLRQQCPQFAERHFATIGVSGGSVGAALSAAAKPTTGGNCTLPSTVDPDSLVAGKVAGTDLLVPSLHALLLSDLVLRFWPGSLSRSEGTRGNGTLENSPSGWMTDRAQAIERALGQAWRGASPRSESNEKVLSERLFGEFSPFSAAAGRDRPALVLLTTDVASGRRIAFSHLRFRKNQISPEPPECISPIDEERAPSRQRAQLLTFDEIAPGRDTTLLAAAVASARFPIISSSATLPCPKPPWRVVDGGYFENSGLTTALELINHMVREAASRKLRVILIRIENSDASKESSPDRPSASDLWTPLQAFMATRDARADNARSIADRARADGKYGRGCPNDPQACVEFEQFVIKLEHCNIPLPLGWSLSAAAQAHIARQLGLAGTSGRKEDACVDTVASENRKALQDLMNRATGG